MPAENEERYHKFRLVFEEYYNTLCNYAYAFIRDKDTCEDIVQEIFLRIWEKKRDIVLSVSIRYYLFTAVRNNCLTYLKLEKKAARVSVENEDLLVEIPELEKDPDQASDYLSQVTKAIALLPPKCKDVFLMSRFNNYSYKEIAEILGISVKTVENQIGKALKILRDFVKQHKLFVFMICLSNIFS